MLDLAARRRAGGSGIPSGAEVAARGVVRGARLSWGCAGVLLCVAVFSPWRTLGSDLGPPLLRSMSLELRSASVCSAACRDGGAQRCAASWLAALPRSWGWCGWLLPVESDQGMMAGMRLSWLASFAM